MYYGFWIVLDFVDGLLNWMDEKGYVMFGDICGCVVLNVIDWKYLNLKYDIKVCID